MSKNWTRSTALPCSTSNPGSANSVRAAKYARRNGFRTCSATTLPIQGHPDHVQGLSSARPSPELCTSRRLAVGRPQLVGVAGGEPASVDVDLVVDELEVFLYLSELGGHLGAVGLHEGKSFLLVAVPGGYELGVAPDGLDGHAGGPQPGADDDPVEVELVVAPPAAGGAVDGGDDQAGAFVVAQGVHADPGAAGGLGDAQTLLRLD